MATSIYYGHDTESFMRSFYEYSHINSFNIETYISEGSFLYVLLCWLAGNIGITNFLHFKLIIYLLAFILIYKGLKPYSANFYLIVFLYMIGPFVSDAIQMRNTLSVGFLLLAGRYILEGKEKIKAVILIILATLNHATFIFFFLLFLLRVKRKEVVGICFWVGLVLFGMAFFFRNFSVFELAQSILEIEKYGSEVETQTKLGPLVPFFYYIYVCFVLLLMRKWLLVKKNGVVMERNEKAFLFIDKIYDLYRIMAIPLFTCVITISAWRFYRDIALLFFVSVAMFSCCRIIQKEKRILIISMSAFISYFYLWFTNYGQGRAEELINTVFNGDPMRLLGY